MRFICMFFPALIAAGEEIKEKDDNFKKIAIYGKYCVFINFLMIIVLILLGKASLHFDDLITVQFYAVYLLVSIVFAKVLPKVLSFCHDNFEIKIRRNK